MSDPAEAALDPQADEALDSEEQTPNTGPSRREMTFIVVGAVVAVLIGIGLLAIPTSGEETPADSDAEPPPTEEVVAPEEATEPDRSATPQEAMGFLQRARAAEEEGDLALAEAQLEEGLDLVPLSDAHTRQRFFHRLATLAAQRGRQEASELFQKTGERLGQEEEQARLLLEEGFAALAARELDTARRRLNLFLLRTGHFQDAGAAARSEALARRTLARVNFEDWRQRTKDVGTRLPEPEFTFEGER